MSKMRVMVIEDDHDLLAIYKVGLERDGFRVITASDGHQALDKMLRFKPKILILDLMMPKMSGFEVLEILQAHYYPHYDASPCVVMSALGDAEHRLRAQALGVDPGHYLVKSQTSLNQMLAVVSKIFHSLTPVKSSAF